MESQAAERLSWQQIQENIPAHVFPSKGNAYLEIQLFDSIDAAAVEKQEKLEFMSKSAHLKIPRHEC